MEKDRTAYEIITLDNSIKRFALNKGKSTLPFAPPSPMQMKIVQYLIDNESNDIYQRDLEKVLNLRRSTISGILKTMEKHNIIIRSDSKVDARIKKIELSIDSKEFYKKSRCLFKDINSILNRNITTEELDIFYKVIKQMKENLNEEKEEKLC